MEKIGYQTFEKVKSTLTQAKQKTMIVAAFVAGMAQIQAKTLNVLANDKIKPNTIEHADKTLHYNTLEKRSELVYNGEIYINQMKHLIHSRFADILSGNAFINKFGSPENAAESADLTPEVKARGELMRDLEGAGMDKNLVPQDPKTPKTDPEDYKDVVPSADVIALINQVKDKGNWLNQGEKMGSYSAQELFDYLIENTKLHDNLREILTDIVNNKAKEELNAGTDTPAEGEYGALDKGDELVAQVQGRDIPLERYEDMFQEIGNAFIMEALRVEQLAHSQDVQADNIYQRGQSIESWLEDNDLNAVTPKSKKAFDKLLTADDMIMQAQPGTNVQYLYTYGVKAYETIPGEKQDRIDNAPTEKTEGWTGLINQMQDLQKQYDKLGNKDKNVVEKQQVYEEIIEVKNKIRDLGNQMKEAVEKDKEESLTDVQKRMEYSKTQVAKYIANNELLIQAKDNVLDGLNDERLSDVSNANESKSSLESKIKSLESSIKNDETILVQLFKNKTPEEMFTLFEGKVFQDRSKLQEHLATLDAEEQNLIGAVSPSTLEFWNKYAANRNNLHAYKAIVELRDNRMAGIDGDWIQPTPYDATKVEQTTRGLDRATSTNDGQNANVDSANDRGTENNMNSAEKNKNLSTKEQIDARVENDRAKSLETAKDDVKTEIESVSAEYKAAHEAYEEAKMTYEEALKQFNDVKSNGPESLSYELALEHLKDVYAGYNTKINALNKVSEAINAKQEELRAKYDQLAAAERADYQTYKDAYDDALAKFKEFEADVNDVNKNIDPSKITIQRSKIIAKLSSAVANKMNYENALKKYQEAYKPYDTDAEAHYDNAKKTWTLGQEHQSDMDALSVGYELREEEERITTADLTKDLVLLQGSEIQNPRKVDPKVKGTVEKYMTPKQILANVPDPTVEPKPQPAPLQQPAPQPVQNNTPTTTPNQNPANNPAQPNLSTNAEALGGEIFSPTWFAQTQFPEKSFIHPTAKGITIDDLDNVKVIDGQNYTLTIDYAYDKATGTYTNEKDGKTLTGPQMDTYLRGLFPGREEN